MSDQAAKSAKPKRLGWNPFQKLETREEAMSAARTGAIVGVYLVFSYSVQTWFVWKTGADTFGNGGAFALAGTIIGVVLAAFLAWRMWKHQGFFSAVFLGLWYLVELGVKVQSIVGGAQKTQPGFIIMFVALAFAAILGVRGAWTLRAKPPAAVE